MVPKPLRLPTENEVCLIEKELNFNFHQDFRDFLLNASDVVYGIIEPVTITNPQSHTHLVSVAKGAWSKMGLPKIYLPICEDNGDYYCLNEKGEIVFWSHNGSKDEKWPSIAHWIISVWIKGG